MVAVTFGSGRVPTADVAKTARRAAIAAPRQSWFARILDVLIAARTEQARREIRLHARFKPYTFDERTHRMVETDTGNEPFGGY